MYLASSEDPHFPNQEPPSAQHVRVPFLLVSHLVHTRVVVLAVTNAGVFVMESVIVMTDTHEDEG